MTALCSFGPTAAASFDGEQRTQTTHRIPAQSGTTIPSRRHRLSTSRDTSARPRPTSPALSPACTPESLFREFLPLVHRLLRRYARNEEQRQEMIGEIYCRFCHLVDAYDPEFGIPLRPYLVRQLSASIHTYARQCWTQAKREKLFHDVFSSDQSDMPNIDPTPEWDRALLLQQIRAALPQALGQLPPRQKQVVIWRYYDGLSYEEIATCLEIHPSTARSLARHGLHKLRAWMQQNRFALA